MTDERGPNVITKGAKLKKRGNVRVTLTLRHVLVKTVPWKILSIISLTECNSGTIKKLSICS